MNADGTELVRPRTYRKLLKLLSGRRRLVVRCALEDQHVIVVEQVDTDGVSASPGKIVGENEKGVDL